MTLNFLSILCIAILSIFIVAVVFTLGYAVAMFVSFEKQKEEEEDEARYDDASCENK